MSFSHKIAAWTNQACYNQRFFFMYLCIGKNC